MTNKIKLYEHFKYTHNHKEVLAEVWFNYLTKEVILKNYTDVILHRPFGINEHPTFKDLEEFMESRCFPRERGNCKEIIAELNLNGYDPFEIVRVNGGNCSEDDLYIDFTEGVVPYEQS